MVGRAAGQTQVIAVLVLGVGHGSGWKARWGQRQMSFHASFASSFGRVRVGAAGGVYLLAHGPLPDGREKHCWDDCLDDRFLGLPDTGRLVAAGRGCWTRGHFGGTVAGQATR